MNEENTRYTCPLCGHVFGDRRSYWYHTKKMKSGCMTKEQCIELLENVKIEKNKRIFYETRMKKQKTEIKELQQRIKSMEENFGEDYRSLKTQNFINNVERMNTINTNNNIDIGQIVNIQLSKPEKERMDHLKQEMLLKILCCKDFDKTVTMLTKAVYFNPNAPENMTWCVRDKKAKFGAIEYNHETNTLLTKMTDSVINENVQNMMSQIVDIIDDLQKEFPFNKEQALNHHKLFNLFATELNQECLNGIKELAYEQRHLSRALWSSLQLVVV